MRPKKSAQQIVGLVFHVAIAVALLPFFLAAFAFFAVVIWFLLGTLFSLIWAGLMTW